MNVFCRIFGHKWLYNYDIGPPDGWCRRRKCKEELLSPVASMAQRQKDLDDILNLLIEKQKKLFYDVWMPPLRMKTALPISSKEFKPGAITKGEIHKNHFITIPPGSLDLSRYKIELGPLFPTCPACVAEMLEESKKICESLNSVQKTSKSSKPSASPSTLPPTS